MKINLIKCVKASVEFFTISPNKTPDVDLGVAFHQLNINPFIGYMAQRIRQKSSKKDKPTRSTVQELFRVNFISELKV